MQLRDAERLVRKLMDEHGLIDSGWTFKWDNAKRRRACAHMYRDGSPGWISASRVLFPIIDDHKADDALRHEIAHAVAGPKAGHGPEWKLAARRVGADPTRCYHEDDPDQKVKAPWVGTCPNGHTSDRHQQPVRVHSCGKCRKGAFDARYIIRDWTFNDRPTVPSHPRYVAELRKLDRLYGLGICADSIELRAVASGPVPVVTFPLPKETRPWAGATVVIGGRDKFTGLVGKVEKIGRSRYHVRIETQGLFKDQLVTVPFILVRATAPYLERD